MSFVLSKKNQAFSLMEISIVLVVIGLLIAGSLSFSVIIDKAKTQALVNELTEINKGVLNFKNIYGNYPGLLTNDECDKYEEFRPKMITSGTASSTSSTGAITAGTDPTYAPRKRCGNTITSTGAKTVHNSNYPLNNPTGTLPWYVETIRACYAMRMLVWSGLVSLTSDTTDLGDTCTYETAKDLVNNAKNFRSKKFPTASYLVMPIGQDSFSFHSEITTSVALKSLYPAGQYAVFLVNNPQTVGAVPSSITEAATVKLTGSTSAYRGAMTGVKYNASSQFINIHDGNRAAENSCNNGSSAVGANGYDGQPDVKYLQGSTCNILYKVQE